MKNIEIDIEIRKRIATVWSPGSHLESTAVANAIADLESLILGWVQSLDPEKVVELGTRRSGPRKKKKVMEVSPDISAQPDPHHQPEVSQHAL